MAKRSQGVNASTAAPSGSTASDAVHDGVTPRRDTFFSRPTWRVGVTWFWSVLGPLLTAVVLLLIWRADLTTARGMLAQYPYVTVYFELVGVGALPVLFTLLARGPASSYGLQRAGLIRSLLLSAALTGLVMSFSLLTTGQPIAFASPDIYPAVPWNLWYALIGVLVYGPLEVFFVVWLIVQTDRIFRSARAHFLGAAHHHCALRAVAPPNHTERRERAAHRRHLLCSGLDLQVYPQRDRADVGLDAAQWAGLVLRAAAPAVRSQPR